MLTPESPWPTPITEPYLLAEILHGGERDLL